MGVNTLEQVFSLPSVTWDDRHLLPRSPGVYFVFGDDLLIYIGKTTKTLYQRWRNHAQLPRMRHFGTLSIAYVVMEGTRDVGQEEVRLIRLFEPALNIEFVPDAYSRMATRWPHLRDGWDKNRKPRKPAPSPD